MSKEYDQLTASHYAAYRPPLHAIILEDVLDKGETYKSGLDVGCGTGHSAIALSAFCQEVTGIEPSKDMLSRAISHSGVHYQYFDGQHIHFTDQAFDLITFAGSLVYAKSQLLLDETIRVGKKGGQIIVYDFEILLDPIVRKLGIDPGERTESSYNHEEDFSGLRQAGLDMKHKQAKNVFCELNAREMGHLLLSAKDNYKLISDQLGRDALFERLISELELLADAKKIQIEACTYSTVYAIQ